MNYQFSSHFDELKPSLIREMLKRASQPGIIPFASGNPAIDAFPTDMVKGAMTEIMEENPISMLQYSATEGYAPLRETLKKYLKEKENIGGANDELITVSGAQQAIQLACQVFCEPGDSIICDSVSFIGSLNSFRTYGANLIGVPIENDGISIEGVKKAIAENKRIKLIYVIPNFQNPTGITMSLEKRKALYEIAKENNIIIIEDNPYGVLRFAGEPLPCIKSFDTEDIVIYCGSYSKMVSPALRVGFVCAHNEIISKIVVAKQCGDVHTNTLAQHICHSIMSSDSFDDHISRISKIYGRKCKLMMDTIKEHFPEVEYTKPEGGMFIWVTLPEGADMPALCEKMLDNKVATVPGSTFLADTKISTQCFRMNYSTPSDEQIVEGVKIVGKILRESL